MFFEISDTLHSQKFQKTLILASEAKTVHVLPNYIFFHVLAQYCVCHTFVILTKVCFWIPAMGAIPTNFLKLAKHSSCDSCGDFELWLRLSVPPFCFRFSNLSRTLARFLSACRCLYKMKYFFQQKIFELELFTKNKAFHSKLKHRKKFHFLGTMHSLPQRLKLTFKKKILVEGVQKRPGVKKKC